MASAAEMRILPLQVSFRVLQMDPARATPQEAARAVEDFLRRKRPGLAQALEISADGAEVVVHAWGEAPAEMLREAHELLGLAVEPVDEELEVDPGEFAVEVLDIASQAPEMESELLRSKVRSFPCPVCEWFDITAGELVLSDLRVCYEPEWAILTDEGETSEKPGAHAIPLSEITRVYRGEWWDVPCLMIETRQRTYRYGWPAERGDPERVFDVDEWVQEIRGLLQRGQ